ncbi:aldose epimerase family protein [Agromyces cerinus]|uniref:Galactose mutarotase n=1 Tax=Agromyces cerinus subsp. cerinus TaxID=232089 RepID=A0A1N6GF80_9MICO|nr:hypothetical protein [Agromyces cerinus]SIO06137.1 Galactose mutarotase [Agromyces cerinus subsp. cerinus]
MVGIAAGRGRDLVAVEFDPLDGARITSLVAAGREWLAPSPPRDPAGDFTGSGTGGWDEVVPTVAACTMADGTRLPDHGDAWRLEWTAVSSGPSMSTAVVSLRSVPVQIARTLTVAAGRLRAEYVATATGDVGVPLLWAAHPLFAAPPGTRLVAGDPETPLVGEHPESGSPVAWPGGGGIDGVSGALKAFASGQDRARIEHADGQGLTLRWDADVLPHLGLFWDTGMFADQPVVAIEPTTGRRDAASAVEDELPVVRPGHPLRWWLEFSVDEPAA